jgi:hypothetical protein
LRTLGRKPKRREVDRIEKFLAQYEASVRKLPPGEDPVAPEPVQEKALKPAADNPDDVPSESEAPPEEKVQPRTPQEAAWTSFVQALYASAEFRFVR